MLAGTKGERLLPCSRTCRASGDEGQGEGGTGRRSGRTTSAISRVGCLGPGDGGGDKGFVAALSPEHRPDEPRKGEEGDELGAVEATRSSWTCPL